MTDIENLVVGQILPKDNGHFVVPDDLRKQIKSRNPSHVETMVIPLGYGYPADYIDGRLNIFVDSNGRIAKAYYD